MSTRGCCCGSGCVPGDAGLDAGACAPGNVPERVSARDAGFTLLEIVVALVVLGILLLTLARGTQFGLAAFERQNGMVETAGRLEAVDRTLRRLVGEADPGNSNDGRTLAGAAHAIAFRAPLPTAGEQPDQPGSGMANLRLSVQDGALMLLSTPYRHVIETGPAPKPARTVLLEKVEALDLSYWADGRWRTGWDGIDLPDLVRIRIVFPDGDPRRWPDIVVAPMRHQPG